MCATPLCSHLLFCQGIVDDRCLLLLPTESDMSSMVRFIVQRAVRSALTLWLVVTIVFIVLRLSGDPARLLLPEGTPPAEVASLRQAWGLDEPVIQQYLRYFAHLAHGDFGTSFRQPRPAFDLVLERLPATAELAISAFVCAALIGVLIGTVSARTYGSPWDRSIQVVLSLLQASPAFVVGIMLILIFSVRLHLLPSSGRGAFQQLFLPVLTISLVSIGSLARLARACLLDVLNLDYIRTARSKGLGESTVIIVHAWRNAALPLITILALDLSSLLMGTVIVETVFAWPGLGRFAVESVTARDYPVVQATVVVFAFIVVGVNFLVDCSYALLDPRLSLTEN